MVGIGQDAPCRKSATLRFDEQQHFHLRRPSATSRKHRRRLRLLLARWNCWVRFNSMTDTMHFDCLGRRRTYHRNRGKYDSRGLEVRRVFEGSPGQDVSVLYSYLSHLACANSVAICLSSLSHSADYLLQRPPYRYSLPQSPRQGKSPETPSSDTETDLNYYSRMKYLNIIKRSSYPSQLIPSRYAYHLPFSNPDTYTMNIFQCAQY